MTDVLYIFARVFCLVILTSAFGFASYDDLGDLAGEDTSLLQVVVERDWGRGKIKSGQPPDGMEDDLSLMQTQVSSETRQKPVRRMLAGVSPDGDMEVAEDLGYSSHRPPIVDDAFSLLQATAFVRPRKLSDDREGPISLFQEAATVKHQGSPTVHQAQEEQLDQRSVAVAFTVASDVVFAAARKMAFDMLAEKLTLQPWERHEWTLFAICVCVLVLVFWNNRRVTHVNSKDRSRVCSEDMPPLPQQSQQKKMSLTLPLRQLLDLSNSSVRLLGGAGSPSFVATSSRDEAGRKTVQLASAFDPARALMSVGALQGSKDGGAVYRPSTGCTLGTLRADGPGSWILSKNGGTSLTVSAQAPATLVVSSSGLEVAWLKPQAWLCGEATEPTYVEMSFCKGGDTALVVACALATLIDSFSTSVPLPR